MSRTVLHHGGRGSGKEILRGRTRMPIEGVRSFADMQTHAFAHTDGFIHQVRCGHATTDLWLNRHARYGSMPQKFAFIADPKFPLCRDCVADIESEIRQ